MVIFGDSFLVAALHVIEQLEATETVPLRDTIALPFIAVHFWPRYTET